MSGQKPISRLGARKAVLVDLSPAATFIAYNYNTPVDIHAFEKEARRILKEIEKECGWMYETWHPNCDDPNRVKGKINYTIWSDVFVCPSCGVEMVLWDVAVDHEAGKIRDSWPCTKCNTFLAKSPRKMSGALRVERAWETRFDMELRQTIHQARQVPVLINYMVGKSQYKKDPDFADLQLIQKIEEKEIAYPIPTNRMPEGDESRRNDELGITHVHHFYTKRNLWGLSVTLNKYEYLKDSFMWISGVHRDVTKLVGVDLTKYFHGGGGPFSGGVKGTLYIPSIMVEKPVHVSLSNRLATLKRKLSGWVNINKNSL